MTKWFSVKTTLLVLLLAALLAVLPACDQRTYIGNDGFDDGAGGVDDAEDEEEEEEIEEEEVPGDDALDVVGRWEITTVESMGLMMDIRAVLEESVDLFSDEELEEMGTDSEGLADFLADLEMYVEFTADGGFTMMEGFSSVSGSYEAGDSMILITVDGETAEAEVNGDTLTLYLEDEGIPATYTCIRSGQR